MRACRRVLKPGGRLAFYTIFIAPGLSPLEYRRAARSGPGAAAAWRRDHGDLLRTAGFTDIAEIDLTAEFLQTARAWYEGRKRRAADLIAADGEADFAQRQRDAVTQIKAIEDGLLRRSLFVARRP